MFEDFSFCTECEHYDQNDRLCKLFHCVRVNGCQCGVERKPRNHFEMLKAMSMEEMAVFLANTEANFPPNFPDGVSTKLCTTAWLEWLKEGI